MNTENQTMTKDGAALRHRQPLPLKIWHRIVDGMGALGTFLIAVLMLIICSDVVARNLLGASLPLVSELSALTLVMIVFLQLGTTIRHNRLARTEMFPDFAARHFPWFGNFVAMVWEGIGALACGTIAYSTYGILIKDLNAGAFIGVTGVLTLPTSPFRVLILIGAAVASIQFAIQFFAAARQLFRSRGDVI